MPVIRPADRAAVRQLLTAQCNVIAFWQADAAGLSRGMVRAAVEAQRWQRWHRGVYIAVTGEPSWIQRVWAAILACGPTAAATRETALALEGVDALEADRPHIFVAVDHRRQVGPLPGVTVTRRRHHSAWLHPLKQPPRDRLEHALLEVASGQTDDSAAIAVIADAVQQRRTSPARLQIALRQRGCMPRRRLLEAVVDDVATGAYSLLEVRYLRDVERAHGLPRSLRQVRAAIGSLHYYRDADYAEYGLLVELDGRLGHEAAWDRWADMDRDNAALAKGALTLRLGYRQVVGTPCRAAMFVAEVLRSRGWAGLLRPCGPHCEAVRRRVG